MARQKMSKSCRNAVSLFESLASMEKKRESAFTDPNSLRKGDPGNPEVCNIYAIHGALQELTKLEEIDNNRRSSALGCADCKKWLAEALTRELDPIRRRAAEPRRERHRVTRALEIGA